MLKGTIYLTIRQIVYIITNFVIHTYLGRKLGPELYGIFGVINAFIIINEFMFLKGTSETISKFVAEKENAANTIVRNTVFALGIVSIIIGFVFFLLARQFAYMMNDKELVVYLRLYALIIPISVVSAVFLGAFNGLRQFGKQASVAIVFSVVRLIAVFILVFLGFSLKGVLIGLIFSEVIRLILSRWLYNPINADADYDRKRMTGFILQLILIGFIASLVMNIDLLAVKTFMKDNYKTGLYTSALTIARIGVFFVYPVSLTVLPAISKTIAEGDMMITEQHIKQSLRLLLILILPISLIIIATSKNCLSFFYGERYAYASGPLNILVIGAIFFSIKIVIYNIIVASGRPGYVIFIGISSLFIEIILLFILINKIGLMGAATASTVTELFGLSLSYYYVARKFLRHKVPYFLIRILLASFVIYMIAVIYSPPGIMMLLYYAILMCFFFFLLVITKEIKLQNLKLALSRTLEDRQNRSNDR